MTSWLPLVSSPAPGGNCWYFLFPVLQLCTLFELAWCPIWTTRTTTWVSCDPITRKSWKINLSVIWFDITARRLQFSPSFKTLVTLVCLSFAFVLSTKQKSTTRILSKLFIPVFFFSQQNTSSMSGYSAVPMKKDTFLCLRSVQIFVRWVNIFSGKLLLIGGGSVRDGSLKILFGGGSSFSFHLFVRYFFASFQCTLFVTFLLQKLFRNFFL